MTSFPDALKRLQIIYNETTPDPKSGKDGGSSKTQDEFSRLKKSIHQDVKALRLMIKEREELLGVKPGSKEAAESSHRIRTRLKALKEDASHLSTIQKQDLKKDGGAGGGLESAKMKEEVVALVYKHIEECENLEKKRYTDKVQTDRSALFDGAISVKIEMANFNGKPNGNQPAADGATSTTLPDIDTEVQEGLLTLQQNNAAIDSDLDAIQANVRVLKDIAINMDRELDKQNEMLDVLDKKADKVQAHLDNINVKMKGALDGVMKGDKFIVNCILICVLLSLVAFIGSQFL